MEDPSSSPSYKVISFENDLWGIHFEIIPWDLISQFVTLSIYHLLVHYGDYLLGALDTLEV